MSEQILGGLIIFNSKDITSTIQQFTAGYDSFIAKGIPGALGIQQNVLNTPMGKCFAIGFMWSSSDLDEGRKNLDRIASFGHVLFNGVKETTIPEWMDNIATFAPQVAYGQNCTISLRKLTEEVNIIIGRETAAMPEDRSTLLSIHQLRGPSEAAQTNSVFGARTAHYCIEFIATASVPEKTQAVWDWAVRFRDAIGKTDGQNILTSTYISLTPPAEASSAAIYGDNWEKLVDIKKEYDPKNVFKHALPKFTEVTTHGDALPKLTEATTNGDTPPKLAEATTNGDTLPKLAEATTNGDALPKLAEATTNGDALRKSIESATNG